MTEFVEAILAQLIGNISTAIIVVLVYFNFLLFENYLRLIVWAILFSQALRQAKSNVLSLFEYLSSHSDIDQYGFLTCAISKTYAIIVNYPNTSTSRPLRELFLSYGIFLFSILGAVSMWMRLYSFVSFFHTFFFFWVIILCLLKVLERRIFYYRYFISDEVLVSSLMILGCFATGTFVMVYLGTESYLEGSRATAAVSDWIQTNVINDENTRQIWSEQVQTGRAMMSAAISGVETNFNDTMWWPPLKSLVRSYYDTNDGYNATGLIVKDQSFLSQINLPKNLTIAQAATLAYSTLNSGNLTSNQLSDWTTKTFEVSSMAFGSVAQLILLIFTLLIAFVSLGIRAFFFVTSIFYLLSTKWDPIERFVEDLLPIQTASGRDQVVMSLRRVIEGVFFLPLKMSSLHAIVTLMTFTLVQADYMYLATTITFFISIVPIIPPYLVCVPWVIAFWVSSSYIKAILLFGLQYIVFMVLDDTLYEKNLVVLNSYVSALSVVFGVYVFGIEGVIFGPLVVCGVTFAYDASNKGIQAAQDEVGTEGKRDAATRGESFSTEKDSDIENDSSDLSHISSSDEQMDTEDKNIADRKRRKKELSTDIHLNHKRKQNYPYDVSPIRSPSNPKVLRKQSQTMSILSNAMYQVISKPLVERVRRKLSMDGLDNLEAPISVSLTIIPVTRGPKTNKEMNEVSNIDDQFLAQPKKVRFIVQRNWSQHGLLERIRRLLQVHSVIGIYTMNDDEVLSPSFIYPNEALYVKVRPKPLKLFNSRRQSVNSSNTWKERNSTLDSEVIKSSSKNSRFMTTTKDGSAGIPLYLGRRSQSDHSLSGRRKSWASSSFGMNRSSPKLSPKMTYKSEE